MAIIRDSHLECGHRFITLIERAMRQAQSMDRLSDVVCPRQAVEGIIALLDGLVVNWPLEPNLFPLAEYASAIVDVYLRSLSAGI